MDLMGKAIAPDNLAEERVLKAFQDGEKEVIVHPDGISSITESTEWPTAENWQGQNALLRASFLRHLLLGGYGNFDPRLITISCAQIEGKLDLSYCESRVPLSFFWCIFSEGICLRAATIPELSLMKCLIGQPSQPSGLDAQQVKVTTEVNLSDQFKAFGKVNLAIANIGGQLVCNGGHFNEGLQAPYLVSTEVNLSDQFKSYGEVNLSGANIGAHLACTDGHFEKGLIAQHLKTGEDVFLNGDFTSNGEVALNGANIGRQLICNGGHFEKGLMAQHLKTGEDVCLRDGFKSNGKVNLFGADIKGQLVCIGGRIEHGLKAQNLKTGTDVILSGVVKSNSEIALFESNGEVSLSGANIGGQFVCTGSYFKEGLKAPNLKTGASVLLGSPSNSNGEALMFNSDGGVDLSGADIGGQLDCTGGYFKEGLNAVHLKTGAGVFLKEGFYSNGKVNLNEANIGGQLACFRGHFEEGLTAMHLKAGADVFLNERFDSNGDVDLFGANIGGQLSCTGGTFQKGLIADGLRYKEIDLGGDWKKGLDWLSKMRGDGFQPYEQLMMVYRRMGKPDWARKIGFELEKKKHEQLPEDLGRVGYSILKWTTGYGYKPFRLLWWAVSLPLFGAILFSNLTQNFSSKFTSSEYVPAFLANEWIPSEGEALIHWRETGQAPQGYPEFQPFLYSLEAVFPVLPLGQLDKWSPTNTFFRSVRRMWTLIGSLLLLFLPVQQSYFGLNLKGEGDGG